MKISTLALTAFFSSFSSVLLAQSPTSTVNYYNISNCTSWTWVSSNSGSGYMCSGYPMTVSVPEVQSMVRALNDVESELLKKISDLEARILVLEKK